jgi:hypothetical protein
MYQKVALFLGSLNASFFLKIIIIWQSLFIMFSISLLRPPQVLFTFFFILCLSSGELKSFYSRYVSENHVCSVLFWAYWHVSWR